MRNLNLEVEFAPEQRLALEKLLASLPRQSFLADDGLGWVYQFWQSKKKEEVNKSGDKIDGRTLSAVTQLFTEHYMVEFLLHNTIGTWWCGRYGIQGPPRGAGIPAGKSPVEMPYLRWGDDGTGAAGRFEGWPNTLAEFTMLDPCCGSGHFLVAAFNLLVPLRMHDEGLAPDKACEAVLRDNLFGLELDPRCTQIAAFALALAAWKYPNAGGYRPLPNLNIACSGQGVVGTKEDWTKFDDGDKSFIAALGFLYDEFEKAPTLGSLINPRAIAESIFQTGFAPLRGLLDRALRMAETQADPDRAAVGVAAQGIAVAASLMARQFTLVATNVPYLARGKQDETMRAYLGQAHSAAKADLATAFVERCLEYCSDGGSTALVTPQNWLFLGSYKRLRERVLTQATWDVLVNLGEEGWWSFGNRGPRTVLIVITAAEPEVSDQLFCIDASTNRGETPILLEEKASRLADDLPTPVRYVRQADQLNNPDAVVGFTSKEGERLLREYVTIYQGVSTGDGPQYSRKFWEMAKQDPDWDYFHESPSGTGCLGLTGLLHTQQDRGPLSQIGTARKGLRAKGKNGVAIAVTGPLPRMRFFGNRFDGTIAAIIPKDANDLAAILTFIKSDQFIKSVRGVDQAVSVTESSFIKVPFDLEHWRQVAADEYPNGLPEPRSNDPTQWLFKGDLKDSTDPLQVAMARLLGYRWPDQVPDSIDDLADKDGIVPIPGVRNEEPASDRLREVLRAAYGSDWSASLEDRLLIESGAKSGASLDDWLRNGFFEQHCKRFHSRPFLWHIWDGRKDGFSALVNYHKLTHKLMENLAYSYLGDWITAQSRSDKLGADLRLAAAQELQTKLKFILTGEPPYDIFVRWKPLHEQSIGWHPDLNDGVRMNIRPFIQADILRKSPNIKWTKDRGKEPERDKNDFPWFWNGSSFVGDRVNDVHLSNEEKQAARMRKKVVT
jgi:N-6 DNA Methylase